MRLVIPILVMLCVPAMADTPTPKPTPVIVKQRLELTVKAVEVPKPISYCGVIAYRTVVRFEVVSVEKGPYADKEIFAVVLCPEWIEIGKPIEVVVEKATPSDQGYVDRFSKGPRWVIRKTL